ncbi:cytochrome c family protein [Limibaculum sp. FT325]|uniref:c-type cytochrome n=1 Tax=Thermohalobaculum sediminis TaxID=2939436 RepID=UPI0020BFC2D3|nr:cytochrome c family protein [Limibaculum sediminis]MCL5778806.1 cytochrome c family protein [Limibaculum sediminis]
MDSGEFNKIAGAVLGAFLLFLLLGFFSEQIYGVGHDEVLAYAVEIEGAETAGAETETVDLAALVASADAAAGEKLFKQCSACHKMEEGANAVGPYLWGVVGRDIAAASGFSYSEALSSKDGVWDLEHLSAFLENPKGYAPGTKMAYGGMKKPQDRVNLIAWLNEADGSPIELAAAPAETATDAAEAAGAAAETAGEQAATAAETATEAVSEAAGAAAGAVVEAAGEAAEAVQGAAETAVAAATGAFADASAEDGAKVFNKCKACHTLEQGKNRVGPYLWGVVGRPVASAEGFSYSDALKGVGGEWTAAQLDAFLADPKGFAPGNKMSFAGVKDAEDRADLIVYLNEADGSPAPLE